MIDANNGPLTPERVRSAAFPSARLGRRGLDEAEVHAFCGWVSDEVARLLSENTMLQKEVARLRDRVLGGKGNSGIQPEDGHVQAVYVLSKAQQTADRYVAEAQDYSREIAKDARMRGDEILREAKVRASMILEEAHASASQAASAVGATHESLPASERQELQAEIVYLRTFSDVCRTHLRAYMESLTRSIEEWEQVEHAGAIAARNSRLQSSQHVPSPQTMMGEHSASGDHQAGRRAGLAADLAALIGLGTAALAATSGGVVCVKNHLTISSPSRTATLCVCRCPRRHARGVAGGGVWCIWEVASGPPSRCSAGRAHLASRAAAWRLTGPLPPDSPFGSRRRCAVGTSWSGRRCRDCSGPTICGTQKVTANREEPF